MKNYILGVDTETTGLLVSKSAPLNYQPHVIEVAFIFLNKKLKIKKEWERLIRPPIPIQKHITNITGMDDLLVKKEKRFDHYLKAIKQIVENADLLFGHNVFFDFRVLQIEFQRRNLKLKQPPLFCTIEQTRNVWGIRMKNNEIYEQITRTPFEKSHRAMPDIQATYQIFKRIYK